MNYFEALTALGIDGQERLALLLLENREDLRKAGFSELAHVVDTMLESVLEEHMLGAVGDVLMEKMDADLKQKIFNLDRPYLDEMPKALLRAYQKLGRTMPVRLKPLLLEVDEDPVFPAFLEELEKEIAC